MSFEVRLEQFSGPLQLLLDLIEGEELPITEVSLAAITDDYLRHVNANDVPSEELADFLIVATKLLYIKSKAILPVPTLDDEEDASHLADQLRMYKAFVDASRHIEALYGAPAHMRARDKMMIPEQKEIPMPDAVTPTLLKQAFDGLLKRLQPFFSLQEASIKRVVSVQERIRQMQDAIMERSRLSFRDVVKGAQSKVDVVVSFLALLELVKQRVVSATQSESFDDIEIVHAK